MSLGKIIRKYKTISLVIFISCLLLASLTLYFYLEMSKPIIINEDRIINIPKGSSLLTIINILKTSGIEVNEIYCKIYVRLFNVSNKLKSGEFQLKQGFSTIEILQEIIQGKNITYKITFPEGYNIFQIAKMLDENGIIGEESFLLQCFDADFLISLNVYNISCEGYLYPETYFFSKGSTASSVIKQMVNNFWTNFQDDFKIRTQEFGFSINQLITLSSMVEKETGRKEERVLISSVFHNRLKKGMRLQCDPTVIYGIEHFDGDIKKQHLYRKTPYNTYILKGLPIGPIANPGLDSIKATLYPAKTKYLYFVSRNDGSHYFSETIMEHNRAVRMYQLIKNQ